MSDTSTTGIRPWPQVLLPRSWRIGAGYLAVYVVLDWASYVGPLPHTSITAWNPNTGVAMALLLARGWRWAPLVAFGIFAGELLTDQGPPPWQVLALTSTYLAVVYACAASGLRRLKLVGPIETPKSAAWFVVVVAAASGIAGAGYVVILVSAGQVSPDATAASIAWYWIGELSGIIALTPLLLVKVDRAKLWEAMAHRKRELTLQALGAVIGVGLALALAAAHDVRPFYPLFAPVMWIALRHGVPGAMISVSLVQAAVVVALDLTPGSMPLFDVQFPLLSLGVTALFIGALATERDATLRQMRQQDAALQRSMRFAVAGQLASALTHELNQPMTALLSYVRAAELMGESVARADSRLAETLHKAGEEAGRGAAVLRRLREFYRGEAARLELTDPLVVCTRVANALHDRMRRSGVELHMRGEGLPAVMVDRTQLEIVIYNLLINCLDAFDGLPAGGGRTRRIEVAAEARGPDVLIRADDSGPGISTSLTERLFEPFVSSKISGMGLGLSLSRTFLRNQGGDLWSEPGRLGGASFVVRLAIQPSQQTSL